MRTYDVYIERSAERDLRGILRYITETLKEPQAARRIFSSVRTEIFLLRQFPARHSITNAEPYSSQGVRKMPVENYTVFYTIDENARRVNVFRVLYNRRDWENLL